MDVVSLGPLPVASIVWQPRAGAWVLTVIVKATYLLRPGEAVLAPSQEPPTPEDRYLGDDPARSLIRPRDLVPVKPLADVLLVGSAFAPDRRPVRSVVTRLVVAELDKRVEVVADRRLGPSGLLEGAPFTQMSLSYERADGGPGTCNPAGVPRGARDAEGRVIIPNLQHPGVTAETFDPIGFGPLAPTWPDRRDRLQGAAASFTMAELATRPLPEGMDLGFFNAAPRDQQVRALHAAESIMLEHLHPEFPQLTTRLPGFAPRATLEGHRGAPVAVALRADTLWIDTDRGIATLTFRGMVPLEAADEEGRVTVAMERPAGASDSVVGTRMPEVQRAPRHLQATAGMTSSPRAPVLPFAGGAPPGRTPSSPPIADPSPEHAPAESPWASGPPRVIDLPRVIEPPAPILTPRAAPTPSALEASNAAAGAVAPRVDAPAPKPAPEPEPARPAPRPEVRAALELVWFDPESMPRMRRQPAWRAILSAADKAPRDPDFDDPAFAKDPAPVEDRREAFEILARAEATDLAGLEVALAGCQRDDGKFIPRIALFAGALELPFDELAALRATISTVTPLVGNDDALRATIDSAKELLALPDLLAAPGVAEGLTRRIEQAFAQGKRAVPADYLETQRERVLLEQRRYQRRTILGEKHLRALLRFEGAEAPPARSATAKAPPSVVPVYLPEITAAMLPLEPRFRARFVAEIRLAADPIEAHPAALRVLALARAVAPVKR